MRPSVARHVLCLAAVLATFMGAARAQAVPEFQKILVGQSTPEKATDAIIKGLDAAIN